MTHTCKWKRVVTHSWNDDVRAPCKRAMGDVSYVNESCAMPSIWRSHVTMNFWILRLVEDVKRDWTPIFTNHVTHWNESSQVNVSCHTCECMRWHTFMTYSLWHDSFDWMIRDSECVMSHIWMHGMSIITYGWRDSFHPN